MVEKLPRDVFPDDVEQGTMVKEESDALAAPEGGFLAWVQCASSFFLFMGTWGTEFLLVCKSFHLIDKPSNTHSCRCIPNAL